jgi:hypothetical protein
MILPQVGWSKSWGFLRWLMSTKKLLALISGTLLLMTTQVVIISHHQQEQVSLSRGGARKKKSSLKQQYVPYYQLWDHVHNSIDIPMERRYPHDPNQNDLSTSTSTTTTPTSLEILQAIIQEYQKQQQAQHANGEFLSHDGNDNSCFKPNLKHTQRLANRIITQAKRTRQNSTNKVITATLPFPVLNMGFPKSGSSSLMRWFQKAHPNKYNVSHFVNEQNTGQYYIGLQMLQSVLQNQSPFSNLQQYQVHAQMDYTSGVGGGSDNISNNNNDFDGDVTATTTTTSSATFSASFSSTTSIITSSTTITTATTTIFPQIQLLDEIHLAQPNATFVLLFRPVQDWISSTQSWNRYPFRWAEADIPGLILTSQQRYERDVLHERIVVTPQQLQDWWCTHVRHIREFVKHYPTHPLIELDVYDSQSSSLLLSQLFGVTVPATVEGNDDEVVVSWDKANSNTQKRAHQPNDNVKHDKHSWNVWNFTTNTLVLDNDETNDQKQNSSLVSQSTPSSLHVLQEVLHDESIMTDPSCFWPRQERNTTTLMVSFPILHVGLPMDPWNDMLKEFFSCLGLKVTHRRGHGGKFGSTGKKIKQAIEADLLPLSSYFGSRQVYTQLDYTATLNSSQGIPMGEERSVFPQIQLLDDLHAEVPNATWLLPFPNINDWLNMAQSFHNFTERWARMEMPGLILTEEQYTARPWPCPSIFDEETGMDVPQCLRLNDPQLKQWWCGHVHHIRQLVDNLYPSHPLLELDLDEMSNTKKTLQILFPEANETCLTKLSLHPVENM